MHGIPGEPGQHPGRLSIPRKIGYASAQIGMSAAEIQIGVFLMIFYQQVVGLSPFYTGLAIGLGILYDGFTDPVMGVLSDRTRTRAGRRRPYFIPGALALAAGLILIFHPPAFQSDLYKFLYLLVSYLFFSTAMTIIDVPHLALGGEMSFDRNERTTIFGFLSWAGLLGTVMGMMLPVFIMKWMQAEPGPGTMGLVRAKTALALAIPILGTALWSFLATRGRDVVEEATTEGTRLGARLGIFGEQLSALRNRYFLALVASAFSYGMANVLWTTVALFYYQYRLGFGEKEATPKFMMPWFLTMALSVPIWLLISRRFGKKRPAVVAAFLWGITTSIFFPFFPEGKWIGPFIVIIFSGFLGGSLFVVNSMVADNVDHDELKTGVNREGLFFGIRGLAFTLTRSLGMFLSGTLLTWVAVEKGAESLPEQAQWRLALVFGPGVGIFQILAACFLSFALPDAKHRRVQELLTRKRKLRARWRKQESGG